MWTILHLIKSEFNDSIEILYKASTLAPMAMMEGILGLALVVQGSRGISKMLVQYLLNRCHDCRTENWDLLSWAGLGQYNLAIKDFEASC